MSIQNLTPCLCDPLPVTSCLHAVGEFFQGLQMRWLKRLR